MCTGKHISCAIRSKRFERRSVARISFRSRLKKQSTRHCPWMHKLPVVPLVPSRNIHFPQVKPARTMDRTSELSVWIIQWLNLLPSRWVVGGVSNGTVESLKRTDTGTLLVLQMFNWSLEVWTSPVKAVQMFIMHCSDAGHRTKHTLKQHLCVAHNSLIITWYPALWSMPRGLSTKVRR